MITAFNVNASEECALTDEYKAARKEVANIVYGSNNDYKRCLAAVTEYEYWVSLSKCIEAGDGKNVGGGCSHLVGRGKYSNTVDSSQCDTFKFEPSQELAKKVLQEITQENNIIKCKK
ncbi:hypothetical protein [Aliikangiella sp. IMCC44632]